MYKLSNTSSNYINFLRAVSSQIVLVGHALSLNKIIGKSLLYTLPDFSVLVFFILSGFVISYSSRQKGNKTDFSNFMIDRFARIYITLIPALIITFFMALIYQYFQHELPYVINIKHFFSCLLMQQENPLLLKLQYSLPNQSAYQFIGIFGENIPLWSLSIEWWHYVFFGIIYYLNLEKLKMSHYILLLISASFVIGYAIFPGRASSGLSFIWFSGVLVNYMLEQQPNIQHSNKIAWLFLVLTVYAYCMHSKLAIVFFIIYFFLSLHHYNRSTDENSINKFFALAKWPSNFSYSIYIIHYPILLICIKSGSPPIVSCIAGIVVSNLVAFLFYKVFEQHYKRFSTFLKMKLLTKKV
jgi:peptidoglycan/LPS O-acetylase OafA/YrhL